MNKWPWKGVISMTHEEYKNAANYWKVKDVANHMMKKQDLIKSVESYIEKNNTCALATGAGEFVRCTPIEYTYYNNAFWLFSEGGEKFIGLEKNKQVCLAIYEKYEGFQNLKGLQVMGVAQIINPMSQEYDIALEKRNIPEKMRDQMKERLHLIKIVPKHIDFLNSEFKKEGEESRQEIDL